MEPDTTVGAVLADAGAAAPDAPVSPLADGSIDWLVDEANPPEFVQALEHELKPGESFKVPRPNIENLDPDVAKVLVNLRRGFHGATARAAAAERTLAEQQAKLEADRAAFEIERQQVFGVFKSPSLLELFKAEADAAPPDPYKDPGAFAEYQGKKGAQTAIGQLLERLGEVSESARKQAEEVLAAKAQREAEARVEAFISERPDFGEHADQIETLIQKHNFSIEDAYNYARFQKGAAPAQPQRVPPANPREAMRVPGPQPANGSLPPTPANLDAYALQDWYDAHPGTRERDAKEYERTFGYA